MFLVCGRTNKKTLIQHDDLNSGRSSQQHCCRSKILGSRENERDLDLNSKSHLGLHAI